MTLLSQGGRCDECDKIKPVLIRLGTEEKHEPRTATVCYDCLITAEDVMARHFVFDGDGDCEPNGIINRHS